MSKSNRGQGQTEGIHITKLNEGRGHKAEERSNDYTNKVSRQTTTDMKEGQMNHMEETTIAVPSALQWVLNHMWTSKPSPEGRNKQENRNAENIFVVLIFLAFLHYART